MSELKEIFKDFCERWESEGPPTRDASSRVWTNRVLKCFRLLGRQRGYDVYPDPDPGRDDYYRHQYMSLDQCWATQKGKQPYSMQLALESEWLNWEEVKEDFDKLADLKCPWKVMVYSLEKTHLDELSNWVKGHKFSDSSDAYLIIIFKQSRPRRGEYFIEGFLMDGSGEVRQLKFESSIPKSTTKTQLTTMPHPPLPSRVGKRTNFKDIEGKPRSYVVRDEIRRLQSTNREKAIYLHLLEFEDGHSELRLGYYMIAKKPRMAGKWAWGQFAAMLPVEDFNAIVQEAQRKGWL